MELIPLLTISILYIVIAYIKPDRTGKIPWNICAICIAVACTWFLLLVLHFLGTSVSLVVIGILMGMSISGLMYKAEPVYKKQKIKYFWFVRLVIILGGLYSALFVLEEDWGMLVVIVIASVLLIIIPTFFFQGITHEDVVEESEAKGKPKSLLKKLDDCC